MYIVCSVLVTLVIFWASPNASFPCNQDPLIRYDCGFQGTGFLHS